MPLLVLLTANLTFWTWDFVEGRMLKAVLDDVADLDTRPSVESFSPDEASERSPAASLYAAAAVLAAALPTPATPAGAYNPLIKASGHMFPPGPAWLTDPRSERVFGLLDVATTLPFEGFPAGTNYSYRDASLYALLRAASARTEWLVYLGQTDAAVASFVGELRLHGASTRPLPRDVLGMGWRLTLPNLQALLDARAGSAEQLHRIADLLAESDDDDALGREFEAQRAAFRPHSVQRLLGPSFGGINASFNRGELRLFARPPAARAVRRQAETYRELIEAAKVPWPGRIDALAAVNFEAFGGPARNPAQFSIWFLEVANIRTARAAVALARFRHDHPGQWPAGMKDLTPEYLDAVPVDPYSGDAPKLVARGGAMVVYTVGPDRKDDGGPTEPGWQPGVLVPGETHLGDIGLRVP